MKVLVIDDDEEDFFMLKELLHEVRDQKFDVEWASAYDLGKEKLITNTHDVCFLDYRLGARTGLDLLREVVADGCQVPIILLTGYGEHDVDLEAMSIGAADYLVKDQVTSVLLEKAIRYAVHRAQSLRQILDRETQIIMQDRLASVGLLASSLAHEIGTPLGVIRGRAEYLEMQVSDNEAVKKNVEVIISQIDRVSKLIRSLMNLARGDRTRHAETVDLREVMAEVLNLMGHLLKKQNIEVRNEMPANIPVPVRAEADPLHQVLLNLLVNSVHAIETATREGRRENHFIRLGAKNNADGWVIEIEDSGCGISEKNLKNLFKPFFTTKEIGVGTGLGLVTSYRIVESWGGSMTVKSQEAVGTEFHIHLPKATTQS